MKKIVYVIKQSHKSLRRSLEWTTASGNDIRIKDMDDSHLINTVLYLSKKRDELEFYNLPMIDINEKPIDVWIDILSNEIKYRGLE